MPDKAVVSGARPASMFRMDLTRHDREEQLNALTHGVGVLLGIAGLVLLVVRAARWGDA